MPAVAGAETASGGKAQAQGRIRKHGEDVDTAAYAVGAEQFFHQNTPYVVQCFIFVPPAAGTGRNKPQIKKIY
jgi:hypothetical protein